VFSDLDKLENINSATKMFLNLFGKTFFLPGQKILYRNNVYESEKTEKHLRKYNVFATLYKYFMFLHHYAGVDNPYNRQGINLLHDYACCMLYLQMIKLTPQRARIISLQDGIRVLKLASKFAPQLSYPELRSGG
jgi:hypothetical protein